MMKKILVLTVLLAIMTGCASAEYWQSVPQRSVVCCDDRPGCQVLQTVMMGSFARFDPEDSLNVRVFSAALPRLAAVTEDDFAHFSEYFDVDAEAVQALYFTALGNCLRSDMLVNPIAGDMDGQNARTVLGLFLNPVGEDAEAQMDAIRANTGPGVIAVLAESAQVPAAFVEHLIYSQP